MSKQPVIEIQSSNSFFWGLFFICLILAIVFIVRQNQGVQVNKSTMKSFVLAESKQQASPIKKYFPTPYSVNDIAKE